MKNKKSKRFDSPTLTYGARGWEASSPKPAPVERQPRKKGIELHTFLDLDKIKPDPTINIAFFTGEERSRTIFPEVQQKEVETHTFLDLDKIKPDPTIDISVFIADEFKEETAPENGTPKVLNRQFVPDQKDKK